MTALKTPKRWNTTLLMIGLVLGITGGFPPVDLRAAPLPEVHVGVIYDGPADLFTLNRQRLIREVHDLVSGEFSVFFDDDIVVDGNWDMKRIEQNIERLLDDSRVDILLGLGVMTTSAIAKHQDLPKPVVVTSVYAGDLGGHHITHRSQDNLNLLLTTGDIIETIKGFLRFKPFKHLAVIVDPHAVEAIPNLITHYESMGASLGLKLDVVKADRPPDQVIASLPDSVDGVLVAPLLSLSGREIPQLIEAINRKKLPGFSLMGRSDVDMGLLAGLIHGADSARMTRRIALEVQRILLHEGKRVSGAENGDQGKIVINMETARKIGFSPGWKILDQAELIHEKPDELPTRNLTSVMEDVITNSSDLEALRNMVAASREDVNKARSYLIPNLTLETTHVTIDQNRAELSFGTESERTWDGSLTATQVLFNEKAWSGWKTLKEVHKSKNQELETLKLDLSLEAAKAYVNILRAGTYERILKNTLKLSEANLVRAKTRRQVGMAGASEVYRWESEIAREKKDMYKAESAVRQAKNALSRIIGESLGQDYQVTDVALSNPILMNSDPRFMPQVDNPQKFRIFCDFMVMEGLSSSPELKQLEAGIKAREQMVFSAGRSFWLPEVAVQGQISDVFDRGGYSDVIDQRDKTAWSVAVNASFPLFNGGGKTADYRKANDELEKIKMEKKAAMAKIEERIRYLIHQAKASYLGITLSRDAAEAAKKNLVLVTDAYDRGVVSIIDLLDAQNAAMKATLASDNAVYDFIIDMMGVQRSIGRPDFSSDKQAEDDFYTRLTAYADQKQKDEKPSDGNKKP